LVNLTINELKKYDGKKGKPAYFACKGIIYDVTESTWFTDGEHMANHQCGMDLTEELKKAPHGEDYFFDIKKVGKLIPVD
jgi:predicted heme/steroid binding protein